MEIPNIQIRVNRDYPEIVNATNDVRIVHLIKDLISSRDGELVGVLQYFFQSQIARSVAPEIAEILEEISIVEMEHIQLLMNAIIQFGGLPTYENRRGQNFSCSYINYTTKLKDILDINIQAEERAIKNYTTVQGLVNNQSLKDLLGRIIEDEQQHLNVFKNLKNTVKFLSY